MAKLVRRGGKLLRKGGKLTRSAIDLNPDSPCECCDQPPPDPGTWICNRATGQCNFELRPGGYATQEECQANCQIGCPTFCYFEIDQRNGVCPSGTYVTSYRPYGPNNPYTLCRIYYPVMGYIGVPPDVSIDPNDSCRLGSQELADYLGGASRSSTLTYKSGVTVNGIACSDGRCYPADAVYGGCPVQVFP